MAAMDPPLVRQRVPASQAAASPIRNTLSYDKPREHESNFGPSVSNFSIQYNLACASIALTFMKHDRDRYHRDTFVPPGWVQYVLLGMVFGGALVGMLTLGYLGDLLGRRKGLLFTNCLVVVGALGSALLPWGPPNSIYAIVSVFRFVLGLGVGGLYPLSSVEAEETASEGENAEKRVGWAFFWQTPGAMAPYLLGLLLLLLPHAGWTTSLQFRVLLGVGAVPALMVLWWETRKQADSRMFESHKSSNPLRDALSHPQYWRTLVGTGGSWFFYDITYYGVAIFTPDILESIFGDSSDSLFAICWQSLVVSSIGLPAIVLGVLMMPYMGAKLLSTVGFLLIALCFLALAAMYTASPDGLIALKFVAFCAITFAINWGPNVTTFILPTVAFPVRVKSTFSGASAALAKAGALVGTFMFSPIRGAAGLGAVMWIVCGLALVGAAVSHFFIPTTNADEEEEREAEREGSCVEERMDTPLVS